MNICDYMSYRMIVCSECKKNGENKDIDFICRGVNFDIDNCIDATAPWDDYDQK